MNADLAAIDTTVVDQPRKRWWRRRPRAVVPYRPILAGYVTSNFWKRHRRALLTMFGIFSFFYGAIFSIFGTFLLLQLSIPLFVMMALSVWLLPNTERAPTSTLTTLLFVFVIVVICWPNYIALALPGMPWITMIRLAAVPLAVTLLMALSISKRFRSDFKTVIDAIPIVWKFVVVFAVLALLSIFVSGDIAMSSNKFVVAQLYWTMIFFVSAYAFVKPGVALKMCYTIWLCALFVSVIGVWEWRHSVLPWVGHIPSFLKIDDESVQGILRGTSRAATGMYRVRSVFTTPLGLGEFLALASPFCWFIILSAKRIWVRLAALASIPLMFFVLTNTDSRLGMVGFFMTILLTLLAWGAMRWRDHPESMVGRLVVLTYPVVIAAFFGLSLVWTRLSNMIWGGGATIPSGLARKAQIASGIPMVLSAPWGHGIGRGGFVLGYHGSGGALTIDTYYLAVALEYGIVGFVVYYGMFLAAIYYGTFALLRSTDPETRLLVPLVIALANFTVIKSVFSQESNHPIVFCLLGAVVALVYRVDGTAGHTRRVREQLAGLRIALPGRRPIAPKRQLLHS